MLLGLCASLWLLNSPEQRSLGSKYHRQFTHALHVIPKLGVGQQSGGKDLFAFHLGSWWIQSLATRWRLDVDKAKC